MSARKTHIRALLYALESLGIAGTARACEQRLEDLGLPHSRETVRHALAELQEAGLVERDRTYWLPVGTMMDDERAAVVELADTILAHASVGAEESYRVTTAADDVQERLAALEKAVLS